MRYLISVCFLLITLVVGGCISTPHKDADLTQLSDEQLIEELDAVAKGLGQSINKLNLLIATRPEPAYYLASSTTVFSGTSNTRVNAFAMPAGYGTNVWGNAYTRWSGTANTQFNFVDANSTARAMNNLAIAIKAAQQRDYRRRGQEISDEINRRIVLRREEQKAAVEVFYNTYPDLAHKPQLVASIAPWVSAQIQNSSTSDVLNGIRNIANKMERGSGLTGDWFGTFAQNGQFADGEQYSLNSFFWVRLIQNGDIVVGEGRIGGGEVIRVEGSIDGKLLLLSVANTTAGLNTVLQGHVGPDQVTATFSGSGADQTFTGTAAFFR